MSSRSVLLAGSLCVAFPLKHLLSPPLPADGDRLSNIVCIFQLSFLPAFILLAVTAGGLSPAR